MLQLAFNQIQTVLCLGAHSDDIEIGCGGTLLSLLAARPDVEVHWVVFGAAGVRGDEAQRSAERFLAGAARQRIVIDKFRDSYFPYVGSRIKEFMEGIRNSVSPDLIFTHRRDDLHQDHRIVSELTGCAFRNHLVLEYEIPKYDGDLGQPNVFVPIDAAICARKTELLLASFPTQRDKTWFTADTFQALPRIRGIECQSPTGLAEGFYSRKISLNLRPPA